MNESALELILKQKAVRVSLVVIGLVVLLSVIYLFIARLTPQTDYQLTPINMRSDTNRLVQLDGDTLHTYNDSAFTKLDVTQDSQPVVQAAGFKLPPLQQVVWAGDQGALIQIGSGSMFGTDMEDVVGEDNLSDAEDSLWYVDFSDGSINPITTLSLMSSQIFYSDQADSFYFLTVNPDTDSSATSSLQQYSVADQATTPIDTGTDYGHITSIQHCKDQATICITGTSIENPIEVTIKTVHTETHQVAELTSTEGVIEPTGNSNYYVVRDTKGQADDDDIDYTLDQRQLYDISTGETSNLDIDSQVNSTIMLIQDRDDMTSFMTHDAALEYKSLVRTVFGTPASSLQQLQSDRDISSLQFLDYGSATSLLAFDADGNLYIVSPAGHTKHQFGSLEQEEVTNKLDECKDSLGFYDYDIDQDIKEVRVYIAWHPQNFSSDVDRVSDCLQDMPELFTSYNLRFSGVNPDNGRILLS